MVIIGAGRLGTALAGAWRAAGIEVVGPLRRADPWPAPLPDIVVLAVPDATIAAVADAVPAGPIVGHCSGATGLEVLGDRSAFSLHPLMTVPADAPAGVLHGAGAAIEATDPDALSVVRSLAGAAGLSPVAIAAADRAAYHAAASIAANFLITLEAAAERVGASAGLTREQLVPLVRAAVDNWATLGPARALTGPVARGDVVTVARQRAALAQRTPDLLELFDALTAATAQLAAAGERAAA